MAEYLAPGVYIEETTYRASSIEGVSTTTTGFIGPTRFGPLLGEPLLVTSFDEFQRHFGGLEPLVHGTTTVPNYTAFAVRAFFENGGRRCYITRTFKTSSTQDLSDYTATSAALSSTLSAAVFKARYPGRHGNVKVSAVGRRSGNRLVVQGSTRTVRGVQHGDLVEVVATGGSALAALTSTAAVTAANLYYVEIDPNTGALALKQSASATALDLTSVDHVQRLGIDVSVERDGRVDTYSDLSSHPDAARFIGDILRTEDRDKGIEAPLDSAAIICISLPGSYDADACIDLADTLLTPTTLASRLSGGADGEVQGPKEYEGSGSGHQARGLKAMELIEDIAIVAAPGSASLTQSTDRQAVREHLIGHCERMQYRFAILSDSDVDMATIRGVRAQHDSQYAALYYPWVVVSDPFGSPGATMSLPPDGFMAGIYARSDIERGVFKAPANEPVRGALRFSRHVTTGQQDVLNPLGINCLRHIEGRGHLVWGARTISSDPEWRYVSTRRLFIYLEHAIDRSTQWAVFEPNNEALWLRVRLTIEAFLRTEQQRGALMGREPKEGFFVRCDRSTMTQNDLDNGRLVCLVGVAPTKPAEFVVFRIGQWTADASLI